MVVLHGACQSSSPPSEKSPETKPETPESSLGIEIIKPENNDKPLSPDEIKSPLESIKALDQKVESYRTGPNLTPADKEFNRQLKREIIRGTFDLYELCRLALSDHWDTLSQNDREYFVSLMTHLLEKKALFSKEQVKSDQPYKINYQKETYLNPEKKKSKVTTLLNVPSEKVTLNIDYKLDLSPFGWKIYDVIVDDASLVENYKFQFDAIIRKHGYPDLVSRMEAKLKGIEKK